ncbi:MAG: GntP family permease [Erysipelotrichaceae bacterium]
MWQILGLVVALVSLILLVFKKLPTVAAVIIASLIAGVLNGLDPWVSLNALASGTGSTFASYFYIVFLATIYGELMSSTGCANTISNTLIKLFGIKRVVLVIILTTALLVYGGVTAIVVCFTIAPIGLSLLKQANISKKYLPAIIAFGQATFALAALPGSPQLNNLIPSEVLHTSSTAGALLGIIAAIIMFVLGYGYLSIRVNNSIKKGEHFEDELVKPGSLKMMDEKECPSVVQGFLPLVILMVLYLIFDRVTIFGYSFRSTGTYSAVSTAMFIAIVYLVILGFSKGKKQETVDTLKMGCVDWIKPLLNFSMIVGFGSVIKITPGFNNLVDLALSMNINGYISAAISVCMLAGVTGSASGGIKIALSSEALVNSWLNSGLNINALHRIISISSCGLDSLPHCGGILATLDVCNENHSRSYWDIFVVTVIVPIITTVIIVILAMCNIGC